ncbi:spore germination protein, partial [Bacillus cereus]
MVIIAPVTITFLIKAAEDSHFNFLTVSFARFYRWIGFLLAVFCG